MKKSCPLDYVYWTHKGLILAGCPGLLGDCVTPAPGSQPTCHRDQHPHLTTVHRALKPFKAFKDDQLVFQGALIKLA